ncbi:beta-galactosidase [Phytoactinopolyspora halotolerans]|uniref:Glycosyl hydrolase n=1 Tax=Phytoactinopolyspora halotolerans TaxID=1981512 RepID=A0A6L9SA90_9ACTN|nr:beta-galactosidase [Phytoactinopolyspora halotolerans]NEE01554.1 glycosyl hydrolase [Phytoactinopolyspora halotolerans]
MSPFTPTRRTVLTASLATAAGAGLDLHAPGVASGQAAAARGGPVHTSSPDDGTQPAVGYAKKRLLIDGAPALVLAGEIHYFRLERDDWQSRLDQAKAAGLDTIATYVPWLWHELPDGTIDVAGETKPERDLGAFIDLCMDNGFHVIPRPGPFIMAETKNNGIPHRVYADHPDAVPTGWDGGETAAPTLDYLAPSFLAEAERWYTAVMPVIADRLHRPGRPGVIAVQLDNEIGMISWVANAPDFTEHLLAEFNAWLDDEYGDDLADRYPFADGSREERDEAIQSPDDSYAAALMHDLGRYTRGRFARYAAELRSYAEASGVTGVPFIINIHGTSGGRGERYPIGVSQLMQTYSGVDGMISGVDMYLGELDQRNAPDLYLINAFTDATNDDDQPLTCLEFDAGHGDYGQALEVAFDPSAPDLKTRMCVAQGTRLINYYLFSGGFNPPLDEPVGDGNERIGTTGERHGFNAPVTPEGERNLSFEPTRTAVAAVSALRDTLAVMRPEHDPVTLGFVPDHYLTQYPAPGRDQAQQVVRDVEGWRGAGPRGGSLARAMLFANVRFDSVDLQAADLDPHERPVLALAGAEHLGTEVQERLVRYVEAGGSLLLAGKLPVTDMAARESTVLADALGLKVTDTITGAPGFYPSVTAHEWAEPLPETRCGRAQLFDAGGSATVFLREVSTGGACGVDVPLGDGRAVVIASDYIVDLTFWRRVFDAVGIRRGITHTATTPGVFLLSAADDDGGRLLHAFNTSTYDDTFTAEEDGEPLFGGHELHLPGQSALMLPVGLTLGGLTIDYATAEPVEVGDRQIRFRSLGGEATVVVRGNATARGAEVTRTGRGDERRTRIRTECREFTVRAA